MIDSVTNQLQTFMDLLSTRQKLVASNIANADTPGYKAQDLDFENSLQSMMDGASPRPTAVEGLSSKNDGNNVDLDREARMLAENSMRFSVASSLMRSNLQTVKEAIREVPTA
jgi:flagellar basal-body rod protein FlgB